MAQNLRYSVAQPPPFLTLLSCWYSVNQWGELLMLMGYGMVNVEYIFCNNILKCLEKYQFSVIS